MNSGRGKTRTRYLIVIQARQRPFDQPMYFPYRLKTIKEAYVYIPASSRAINERVCFPLSSLICFGPTRA